MNSITGFTLVVILIFFATQYFVLKKDLRLSVKKINDFKKQQEKNSIELAHQLQTPLTILKGQLDLANQTSDLEKLDETINKTSTKINNILQIIKKQPC